MRTNNHNELRLRGHDGQLRPFGMSGCATAVMIDMRLAIVAATAVVSGLNALG
jgi:hypothetical protein